MKKIINLKPVKIETEVISLLEMSERDKEIFRNIETLEIPKFTYSGKFSTWKFIWYIIKNVPQFYKIIVNINKLKDVLNMEKNNKTTDAGFKKMFGLIIAILGPLLSIFGVDIADYLGAEVQNALLVIGAAIYGFFSKKQSEVSADAEQ